MYEAPRRESPLVGIEAEEVPTLKLRDVLLQEQPFIGYLNLRFQPENVELAARLGELLDLQVPFHANTFSANQARACVWLGPDEWLIVVSETELEKTINAINKLIANEFATLTDQSSAMTMFKIAGSGAVELLSRGIVFDLHPSEFLPGHSAQTVIAKSPATILNRSSEKTCFELLVRRSFADYLWRWFAKAGSEATFT